MKYTVLLLVFSCVLNVEKIYAQGCGVENLPIQVILNDPFLENYIPDSLLFEHKFLRHYTPFPEGDFYFKGNKCKNPDYKFRQDNEVFFGVDAVMFLKDTIKVMTELHYSDSWPVDLGGIHTKWCTKAFIEYYLIRESQEWKIIKRNLYEYMDGYPEINVLLGID